MPNFACYRGTLCGGPRRGMTMIYLWSSSFWDSYFGFSLLLWSHTFHYGCDSRICLSFWYVIILSAIHRTKPMTPFDDRKRLWPISRTSLKWVLWSISKSMSLCGWFGHCLQTPLCGRILSISFLEVIRSCRDGPIQVISNVENPIRPSLKHMNWIKLV